MTVLYGRMIRSLAAVFVAGALWPAAAHAQPPALSQGSWLVSGQASFNVQDISGDDEKTTSFQFLPALQYFVRPGLAVGGELLLTRTSRDDLTVTSYGVGPALSYYFVQDGDVHPFVRGSARFSRMKSELGANESETSLIGLRAAGGALLLLSESVGLDIGLFFDRVQFGDDLDVDVTTFGLAVGIAAFVH